MVRPKCREFPRRLQVFRNNGNAGEKADKKLSWLSHSLSGTFQLAGKLKKLGRNLCWEFLSYMTHGGLAFVSFGVKLMGGGLVWGFLGVFVIVVLMLLFWGFFLFGWLGVFCLVWFFRGGGWFFCLFGDFFVGFFLFFSQ